MLCKVIGAFSGTYSTIFSCFDINIDEPDNPSTKEKRFLADLICQKANLSLSYLQTINIIKDDNSFHAFPMTYYGQGNETTINGQGGVLNLSPGYGISGIASAANDNRTLFIHTSGFLQESGLAYSRRFIYPHDGMGVAAQTYKTNGVYALNASGTITNPNDNSRMCTHYTNAAASTAVSTIGALINQHLRPQNNISFRTDFKMMVSGGASCNLWCGLINMNPGSSGFEAVVRDARVQCAALFWSLGRPSWYFVVKGNSGSNAQSGAISTDILPIPDSTWHDIHIYSADDGHSWNLEVDDKWAASKDDSVLLVPTSGSAMGPILQIGGTSNSMRNSYMSTRVNSPGPTPRMG